MQVPLSLLWAATACACCVQIRACLVNSPVAAKVIFSEHRSDPITPLLTTLPGLPALHPHSWLTRPLLTWFSTCPPTRMLSHGRYLLPQLCTHSTVKILSQVYCPTWESRLKRKKKVLLPLGTSLHPTPSPSLCSYPQVPPSKSVPLGSFP